MTDYASTTELQNRYEDTAAATSITDNEDAGTPDTTVLTEVIDYAEGQINSYLASRYLVPVDVTINSTLDALLRNMTLDIAMYHLAMRQGVAPEILVNAHDKAISWLEKITDGKVHLPTVSPAPSTTTYTPVANYGTGSTDTDSNRLFTRSQQDSL